MSKIKTLLFLSFIIAFLLKTTTPAIAENYTYKLYNPKTKESFPSEIITIRTEDTFFIGLSKALTICKITTVGRKENGLLGGNCSNIHTAQTYYWKEYKPNTFKTEVNSIIEEMKAQGKDLDDSTQHIISTLEKNGHTNNITNPPYWSTYMSRLQHRIKMNWNPQKYNTSNSVVVLFKIAKDGRLLSCKIYKSSGINKVDDDALTAVRLTAPFEPLPNEYKGTSVDIQFTFDYNVIPRKEQQSAQIQIEEQENQHRDNTIKQRTYKSYAERNKYESEKIVAIYDKNSPAYGYRYVLYTPIGKYVGHHKIMQQSPNGYGLEGIPDGGEGSETPCFRTLRDAKHYYYPEWY